jgi:prepilin-type N-terminal cleavage/methylation domain-containing protein
MKTSYKEGFTFLEMAIVVAIFSVMLMMAIPSITAKLPTYRLDAAQRQINSHMRLARMKALSEGVPVAVTFDGSSGNYDFWTDTNGNGSRESDEVQSFSLPPSRSISAYIWPTRGEFMPNGTFVSEDEYFNGLWISLHSYSTSEDGYRSIIIWPSGQVSNYESSV